MSDTNNVRGFDTNQPESGVDIPIAEKLGEMSEKYYTLHVLVGQLEDEAKKIKAEKESIGKQIADVLETEGLESFKSKAGSHTLYSDAFPSVKDFDEFLDWAFKTKSYEFIQKRVNSRPVKEMLKETGTIPPGIDVHTETRIRTRINSEWKSAKISEINSSAKLLSKHK